MKLAGFLMHGCFENTNPVMPLSIKMVCFQLQSQRSAVSLNFQMNHPSVENLNTENCWFSKNNK